MSMDVNQGASGNTASNSARLWARTQNNQSGVQVASALNGASNDIWFRNDSAAANNINLSQGAFTTNGHAGNTVYLGTNVNSNEHLTSVARSLTGTASNNTVEVAWDPTNFTNIQVASSFRGSSNSIARNAIATTATTVQVADSVIGSSTNSVQLSSRSGSRMAETTVAQGASTIIGNALNTASVSGSANLNAAQESRTASGLARNIISASNIGNANIVQTAVGTTAQNVANITT